MLTRESVFVAGDGVVTALAGGPISLADMGARTTTRASHLEFNPADNEWHVWTPDKTVSLYSHADYDVALQWEIDHFNRRLSMIG